MDYTGYPISLDLVWNTLRMRFESLFVLQVGPDYRPMSGPYLFRSDGRTKVSMIRMCEGPNVLSFSLVVSTGLMVESKCYGRINQ